MEMEGKKVIKLTICKSKKKIFYQEVLLTLISFSRRTCIYHT